MISKKEIKSLDLPRAKELLNYAIGTDDIELMDRTSKHVKQLIMVEHKKAAQALEIVCDVQAIIEDQSLGLMEPVDATKQLKSIMGVHYDAMIAYHSYMSEL